MLGKLYKIFMVPKNFNKNFIMNRPPIYTQNKESHKKCEFVIADWAATHFVRLYSMRIKI